MSELCVTVPVIETERLILREPRLSDLDAFVAFGQSERAKFVGYPMQPWQSWNGLLIVIGHWIARGFGWWMLEDKSSGKTAGRVGIGYHLDWPEPELGWHLYDGFEGKGLAYEAAVAARNHAYVEMGFGPLISLVDNENTASAKLARKLGATPEAETNIRGDACIIFRHPKVVL